MHHRIRVGLAATALAAAALGSLGLAGSSAAGSAAPPAARTPAGQGPGSFPVTVATPYGSLRLASRPGRVMSLSPTATEMLFAIGAGNEVVAVDDDSDYPSSAPRTSLSGYTPNIEAIAKYRPDLVVISYNPTPPDLVSSLRLLHIPVLYLPAATELAGTYGELAELGKVTGDRQGAQRLIAKMRGDVAGLVGQVPLRSKPLTYYYELDPTYYTATGDTFVGSVLALAGLRDITGPSVHGDDYPQLSAEAVLRANPTFIFLADGASVASVAARPGWSGLSAVRDRRVIALNEDVASRWGPRVVDLLRAAVAAARSVPGGTLPARR